MLFSPNKQLCRTKSLPATNTTNFLAPCDEETFEQKAVRKRDVVRSMSCEIEPKKPHPFRSPIMSLITHSLPRVYKKRLTDDHLATRIRGLSVSNDSSWNTEEDFSNFIGPYVAKKSKSNETTEDTPFKRISYQPYYPRRHLHFGRSFKKHSKSYNDDQRSISEESACKSLEEECEVMDDGSLRRRASSLDFLPEVAGNVKAFSQQNGNSNHQNDIVHNNNKHNSPFARTTSMSQRSPFKKKPYIDNMDNSVTGIREMRPKNTKRSKSGLEALFDAVERQDIAEIRKLINTQDININETNSDQFTALDIALMLNFSETANVLLNYGAKENPDFLDPQERLKHFASLMENVERYQNNLKMSMVNGSNETKDMDRQISEKNCHILLLNLMRCEFNKAEPPSQPPSIVIAPLSNESIVVSLNPHTFDTDLKEIVTKYKVEWSQYDDFEKIEGEELMSDKRQMTCTISGLEKNMKWYVRVSSGNHKGFSPYGYPEPRAVIPSSWHECDSSVPRYYGVSDKLCRLVEELLSLSKKNTEKSSEEGSDEENTNNNSGSSPITRSPKSKNGGRKLVKSMSKYTNYIFNSAPKLLKKIKGRGIYLAALLYNDDLTKVLVTVDENLPVVECDDNYSKSFNQEFYWFSKTSCTWEDIHHMLFFSNKSFSSPSVQIRRKLLQSALDLMTATGVNDLGPIYFKPFRDDHGSILLLAVNCIKKNSARSMTMKWIPISKLLKKTNSINESTIVPERLIPSVQEQVSSHQRSRVKLEKGLYLGYLKLRTSMDTLSIIVPNSHTNVLPYVKIHDVPNVTKEQWEWLKSLNNVEVDNDCDGNENNDMKPALRSFERRLRMAVIKLFTVLKIPSENALNHRIYDQEVIELNSEVLFLLISPSDVCTPPNQTDGFSSLPGYSALPVQAFEMANMMTYQPILMSSYCRLSSILELENFSMQQNVRETICHNEIKTLKERQARIATLQTRVDELWRVSRWIMDTLQACQDKNLNVGIPLNNLYRVDNWCQVESCRLSINSQHSDFSSERDFSTDSPTTSIMSTEFKRNGSSFNIKIHGTEEIGLSETTYTEVSINDKTTTLHVIQSAVMQFMSNQNNLVNGETANNDSLTGEENIPSSSSSSDEELAIQESSDGESANQNEICDESKASVQTVSELTKSDEDSKTIVEILCTDNLQDIALVVVAGSRERCLREDLNLMSLQTPWEKGKFYLRLKKEALRATKWGLSTTV